MSPRRRAASRASSRVSSFSPSSTLASRRLGVATAAAGSSSSRYACTAPSSVRRRPVEATKTGSTTSAGRLLASAATSLTISSLYRTPVLAPETVMSSMTASICARTKAAGKTWTAFTCAVFWAVTQVIAVVPNTPRAAKVLRSAWIPAPPPESEPAMVSATGGVIAEPRRGGPGSWRTRPPGRENALPLPTPRHPPRPTRGIRPRSRRRPPRVPKSARGRRRERPLALDNSWAL